MSRRKFDYVDHSSSYADSDSEDYTTEVDDEDEISTSDSSSSEQSSLAAESNIPHDQIQNLPHRPRKARLRPNFLRFRSPSDRESEKRFQTLAKKLLDKSKEKRKLQDRLLELEAFGEDDTKENRRMKQLEEAITPLYMEFSGWLEKEQAGGASEREPEHGYTSPEDIYDGCATLEQGQVRTLVVHPALDDRYPLVCTLKIESLRETPTSNYAALSYCWGTEFDPSGLYVLPLDVWINTLRPEAWENMKQQCRRVQIKANLKRALLRLRRKDVPITLWVDAICINQNSEEEKTQQLLQMAEVYRKATHVCVWLGEADSEGMSNRAMKFILKIMDFAFLERAVNDESQAENWYALAELMRDRWFSRRWVVQEIALARKASIYCGKRSVSWTDFADAVLILVASRDKIRELFTSWREGVQTLGEVQSFGANILLNATSRLFLRDANGIALKPTKGIESLVTSLSTFDTSNPCDIVYSLVAIASDTYDPVSYGSGYRTNDNNGACKLIINYELDEVEVYKSFVEYCICSSKSLDIICRPWAMPQTRNGSLPSWVCLLRDSEFGEPNDVYNGRRNGESLVGPVDHPRYNASRGKTYKASSMNDEAQGSAEQNKRWRKKRKMQVDAPRLEIAQQIPTTLWLKGFKLAQVKAVSLVNASGLISRSSLRDIGGWRGIHNSPDSVPEHIWRTLIADRDLEGQVPPTWYQRSCLRCLEIADIFHNGDLNIGQLLGGRSDMLRGYLTRVRNVTWNRRFFRAVTKVPRSGGSHSQTIQTDSVSYDNVSNLEEWQEKRTWDDNDLFGLCPEGTKMGDVICILYGCSVPVILRASSRRPKDKSFKVIGECYVHGKMEGEAVADRGKGETMGTEEVFGLN